LAAHIYLLSEPEHSRTRASSVHKTDGAFVRFAPREKSKTMLWFKHSHDLRNSPAMKQIQRKLGDAGFAAAIRLIEVMTYRSGVASKFNPVLTLAPPTSELWLAQEILTYDEADSDFNPIDNVIHLINEFALAGLIEIESKDGTRPVFSETDDDWITQKCKFTTIKLVEFEELMDVWTSRKVKDAQRKD
jgi:hypothetical protein